MLVEEMEALLRNVDARLARVEQILPTLATREDLRGFATKGDLATFATKGDLATFATKDDLATLATKDDLATLATKDELETVRRHLHILIERERDTAGMLAEHLSGVLQQLSHITARLDRWP
jgi:ribosomal protein L17